MAIRSRFLKVSELEMGMLYWLYVPKADQPTRTLSAMAEAYKANEGLLHGHLIKLAMDGHIEMIAEPNEHWVITRSTKIRVKQHMANSWGSKNEKT